MSIDFTALMAKTDVILNGQGLYTPVTYVEESFDDGTYDPTTGEFDKIKSTTHVFNAVILPDKEVMATGLDYVKSDLSIVVLAQNIEFTPRVDMDFTINDVIWRVISSQLAPQDTVYEISLGRK